MTRLQTIVTGLAATAAMVQGVDNVIEGIWPSKVEADACGQVIESLSKSIAACVSRECG